MSRIAWQRIGLLLVSLALAAAALVLGLRAYYLSGDRYQQHTATVIPGSELRLMVGQGQVEDSALRVQAAGPGGFATLSRDLLDLDAARLPVLAWHIPGLRAGQSLRLIWSTQSRPGVMHEAVIPHQGAVQGRFSLADRSDWQGRVERLGLVIAGDLSRPLAVRELSLMPQPPDGTAHLLTRIGREWLQWRNWLGSSINHLRLAVDSPLLPPLLAVALWLGGAALLYLVMAGLWWRRWDVKPLLLLLLLGWGLLDLHWWLRLDHTLAVAHERYAGKDTVERAQAAADGGLYTMLRQVRQALPEIPARLVLLAPERGIATRYLAYRSRYHLLPHNVLLLWRPQALASVLDRLRPGTYLLLPVQDTSLRFDPRDNTLTLGQQSVAVEPMLRSGLFQLYKLI